LKDRETLDKIAEMTGSQGRSKDVLKEFLNTIDKNDDRILRESSDSGYFEEIEEVASAINSVIERFFATDRGEYWEYGTDEKYRIWESAISRATMDNPNLED
jgi:bisphosphoglycerate-independent phosphoglycerate mutase (AlkP superfamily)